MAVSSNKPSCAVCTAFAEAARFNCTGSAAGCCCIGKFFDIQAVVVMPPFALGQYHLRNLLESEVGVTVSITLGKAAATPADFFRHHVITQCLQLIGIQRLCGHVNEVCLGVTMLPIVGFGRCIGKTFQLAYRRSQHFSVVFLVDHPVAPTVFSKRLGANEK